MLRSLAFANRFTNVKLNIPGGGNGMAKLNLLGQWLAQAESPDNLLDRNIKGFLANRVILAWILKNSVEEFKEFQISACAKAYGHAILTL